MRLADDLVDSGMGRSRAGVVTRALERERRRAVAARDAEILARTCSGSGAVGLAAFARRSFISSLACVRPRLSLTPTHELQMIMRIRPRGAVTRVLPATAVSRRIVRRPSALMCVTVPGTTVPAATAPLDVCMPETSTCTRCPTCGIDGEGTPGMSSADPLGNRGVDRTPHFGPRVWRLQQFTQASPSTLALSSSSKATASCSRHAARSLPPSTARATSARFQLSCSSSSSSTAADTS